MIGGYKHEGHSLYFVAKGKKLYHFDHQTWSATTAATSGFVHQLAYGGVIGLRKVNEEDEDNFLHFARGQQKLAVRLLYIVFTGAVDQQQVLLTSLPLLGCIFLLLAQSYQVRPFLPNIGLLFYLNNSHTAPMVRISYSAI